MFDNRILVNYFKVGVHVFWDTRYTYSYPTTRWCRIFSSAVILNCMDHHFPQGGGGVTPYMEVRDVPFFGVPFSSSNKFRGIIFAKTTSSHKFWGVVLENNPLEH